MMVQREKRWLEEEEERIRLENQEFLEDDLGELGGEEGESEQVDHTESLEELGDLEFGESLGESDEEIIEGDYDSEGNLIELESIEETQDENQNISEEEK